MARTKERTWVPRVLARRHEGSRKVVVDVGLTLDFTLNGELKVRRERINKRRERK